MASTQPFKTIGKLQDSSLPQTPLIHTNTPEVLAIPRDEH